jgi:hypothetical protein
MTIEQRMVENRKLAEQDANLVRELLSENQRLKKIIQEAKTVIEIGVVLMPLEPLHHWYEVRPWLEGLPEEFQENE